MKFTTLLILIFALASCKSTQKATPAFVPSFSISKKTTHKIAKDQAYTFGYLEVLENRENPSGNTIQLPVYIFKSRNQNPKKDPIIYTVGGPGSTSMPSAQYMNYYQYLDDRDFILVEQRGTYYAQPHLACPEWSQAIYQSNLPDFDRKLSDALFAKAASACRERLVGKGIDLDAYTTNEIAADINDLVKVLEIEKYNLLTISYSTKIAQVLMRDYPERIRSVVMDSPLPLEVNYDEESVKNLLEAVELLLADCAADQQCNAAFPDLKNRFFSYLTEKNKNPLTVRVENSKSDQLETFYLDGSDLITVFTSASTGEVANIPFEINQLLNNDLSSVKQQLAALFEGPRNGAGLGMRLSVWCAEEHPFNSQATIAAETTKHPQVVGLSPAVFEDNICKIWNVKKVATIENEAVKSDLPVLLINGEYDNETPPKWAKAMLPNLSNGFHLTFSAWKHTPTTYWSNTCAMQAANDFFNTPSQKPNPDCFGEISKPAFKTDH